MTNKTPVSFGQLKTCDIISTLLANIVFIKHSTRTQKIVWQCSREMDDIKKPQKVQTHELKFIGYEQLNTLHLETHTTLDIDNCFMHSNSIKRQTFKLYRNSNGKTVITLGDKILFEFSQKFQVQEILRAQCFFTNHCLHCLHIFSDSITGVLKKVNTDCICSIKVHALQTITTDEL